jgi:hypothetical protein
MSDEPNPGGGPQKSGVSLPADPPPRTEPASSIGTRSFGDPPDSGGGPVKSGLTEINPPAEEDTEK